MFNRTSFILIPLILYIFSNSVIAESKKERMIGDESLLAVEAIIAANSLIAVSYPEEFGIFNVILSPFYGTSPDEVDVISYAGVGGSASIGLYNALELKKEKYSKSDVFLRNMAIFNLWYGALYLLDSKYHKDDNKLNLIPVNDGLALNLQYTF